MKILLATIPAPSHLNNALALARLLAEAGHRTTVLTGAVAAHDVDRLGDAGAFVLSETHDLDSDRRNPLRRPHVQQLCEPAYLRQAVERELELVGSVRPDLLVSKDCYSTVVTARVTGLPYAAYYTDGPRYLLPGQNPQARVVIPEIAGNVAAACRHFGVPPVDRPVPYCQESPLLNIVRGLPETSGLTGPELDRLPPSTAFAGLLTFDGPAETWPSGVLERLRREPPAAYVNFGTMCFDAERYRIAMEAGRLLSAPTLVASFHLRSDELGPVPPAVQLVDYAPNREAVELAEVVVHHGGHGITLTAIEHGRPAVVIPDNVRSSAQPEHAAMVQRLGLGIHLPRPELTARSLADAVQALRRPEVQERCRETAAAMRASSERRQRQLLERIGTVLGRSGR